MPRTKTAKSIASRLEIDYFKKGERLWFRRSRLIVTALCLVIAVVFWGAYHFRGDKRGTLYNPGPVARAHAAFENECWQCHDVAKGPRAVLKNGLKQIVADSVSDNACLRCHSASVHSANQVQFVMAEKGGADGHAAKSADCTHCHIEHRGDTALRGTSDAHCVQCHENLAEHTRKDRVGGGHPAESRATAFSLVNHPPFGRQLTADGKAFETVTKDPKEPGSAGEIAAAEQTVLNKVRGKLIDPTVLRFNHEKHLKMPSLKEADCTACHTTLDPDPRAKPAAEGGAPPWTSGKTRDQQWGVLDQRSYMLPVSYNKHCAGCHVLTVDLSAPGEDTPSAKLEIPHDRLDVVRKVIDGIPADRLGWLGVTAVAAAAPAAPAGTAPPPEAEPPSKGPRRGPGPRSSDSAEPAAPAQPAPAATPPAATPPAPGPGPRRGPGPRGGSTGFVPELMPPGDRFFGPTSFVLLKGPGPKSTEPDEPATPTAPPAGGGGAAAGGAGFNYEKLFEVINGASVRNDDATKAAVLKEFERFSGLNPAEVPADPTKVKAPDYRAVVTFYTAYLAGGQSCMFCHNVQGALPAAGSAPLAGDAAAAPSADAAAPAAAAGPATGPAGQKVACMDTLGLTPGDTRPLQTVPTGIPTTPRRWYTHSRFDHAGHRNMACVDCHSMAPTSKATCDVLSPNLVWTNDKGELRSCAECHRPASADVRGAGSDCQTCHVYHQRTGTAGEGRPDKSIPWDQLVGPPKGRAPAVAAGGAGGAAPAEKPAAP